MPEPFRIFYILITSQNAQCGRILPDISPGFGGLEDLTKMVYATDYFWVVICKNQRVHHKENTSYAHQIALGETDAFSPLPMLTEQLRVRCDQCGEEYSYKQTEVLRNEIAVPDRFVPHPLFKG